MTGDAAKRSETADVDLVRSGEENRPRLASASRSGSWPEALADPAVRQVFDEIMEAVERERAKEKEQP